MRLCLLSLAIVFVIGCKTTSSWYWVEGRHPAATYIDSAVHLPSKRTFTVIPFSLLDSSAWLKGREENALLFRLVNEIVGRGYRYVEHVKDADIIITQEVRGDYHQGEDLSRLFSN